MNENINLAVILSNHPKGTKLYSTIHGVVELVSAVTVDMDYPITVADKNNYFITFTRDGKFDKHYDGECVLFPSKEQRDWNKFIQSNAEAVKFDYDSLKPFDRMLVRNFNDDRWRMSHFSYMDGKYLMCDTCWYQGIPYNHDTRHLVGTSDMPDKKYIWWT